MRGITIFMALMILIGMAGAAQIDPAKQIDWSKTITADITVIGNVNSDTSTATLTNETAINASIVNLGLGQTWQNTSISNLAKGNTAQNATAANVALGQTAQNSTISNIALGQVYQNTTLTNLGLGQAAQNATAANVALGQAAQNVSLTNLGLATAAINSSKIANKMSDYINTTAINTSIADLSRTTTTATNFTILDTGPDFYFVGNSTTPNTQTILFPTATANAGRKIAVVLTTDPGDNTVILDGENSEQIDGSATKTTTDAVGSYYYLVCDGTAWRKFNSAGTWS